MQYSEPLCFSCKHMQGARYDEERDDTTYYCKAYPKGIPEAVMQSGHIYPKPGDNGIQYESERGAEPIKEKQSQQEEDANYRGYQEYYDEVNMSDVEFTEKMKREHGEDWYLYQKPARADI